MFKKLQTAFINSNEFITFNNLVFDEPKSEKFDFATNIAMIISKQVGKKPIDVANQIKYELENSDLEIEKIEIAMPGFINIRLSDSELVSELESITDFYHVEKQKIVVDYSSPNIAKKMHIGHLRSTVIGDSIVKILRHFGHEVIGDSHIGDWGTQFGKLIYGYENWLDRKSYEEDAIAELQRVYVKFHDEETEAMIDVARSNLVKLQKHEEPYYSLWKEFVSKSMEEFDKTYNQLGVKIDNALGESFFNSMMQPLVDKLMLEKIAVEDKGAKVIFFDEKTKIPPAIIQKKDGGFLYTTSDIACIDFRIKEWAAEKIIYVTDSRQTNHFKQVFAIADKMKCKAEYIHAKFGVMSLPQGSISTRGGNSVDLQDLLNEGFSQARKVVEEKNPTLSDKEKDSIAKSVSIGAIKFFDLVHQRTSDIIFTWEKALSFTGKSSPSIQYAYTRMSSILKKANIEIKRENIKVTNQKERDLVKTLFQYSKILYTSYNKLEPHHIANYLYKLSSVFNSWYAEVKILDDKKNLNSRLYLIKETQKIIKEGLGLLGIDVLETM